jgi:hypothetical protein
MRRHRLSVASFCLAVLSVTVVASAQAEVGSHWNVNGSAISESLVNKGVVPEAQLEGNHGVLLSHALGKELNILCTAVQAEEAKAKLEGSGLGKIRFSGCRVTTNGGEVLPACEPHNGEEKGVVLTKLLKGLLVLEAGGVAGEVYGRVEPEEGTRFVELATSSSCAFGANIPVIGKFVGKDSQLEGKVEKVTHLGEEGPGTELWILSKTEEHMTHIDGTVNGFLTGEHKGLTGSGTPA